MKRCLVSVAVLSLVLTWLLGVAEVAAKNGGGGFRSGGRATREDDGGFRSEPDRGTSDAPVPDAPEEPRRPKKPTSFRSMVRGLLTRCDAPPAAAPLRRDDGDRVGGRGRGG